VAALPSSAHVKQQVGLANRVRAPQATQDIQATHGIYCEHTAPGTWRFTPSVAEWALNKPRFFRLEGVPVMDTSQGMPAQIFARAVLEGGPESLPKEDRSLLIEPDEEKVKIPHLGGYEHFERTATTSSDESVIFLWKTRTKVAE
jgi:hypothetical protein